MNGRRAATLATTVLFLFALTAMSGRPLEGQAAADFSLPTLAGSNLSLTAYQGQEVLLHFWATWCKPCVKEMPEIEAAHRALKEKGLAVIAVNVGEEREAVARFTDTHGFTFPVALDKNWDVASEYNIIGLPVSVFIGRDGRIKEVVQGGSLTRESIAARLN